MTQDVCSELKTASFPCSLLLNFTHCRPRSSAPYKKTVQNCQIWLLPKKPLHPSQHECQAFPPSTWVTGGFRTRGTKKRRVQDVLGTCPKLFWSFSRCLWPG